MDNEPPMKVIFKRTRKYSILCCPNAIISNHSSFFETPEVGIIVQLQLEKNQK